MKHTEIQPGMILKVAKTARWSGAYPQYQARDGEIVAVVSLAGPNVNLRSSDWQNKHVGGGAEFEPVPAEESQKYLEALRSHKSLAITKGQLWSIGTDPEVFIVKKSGRVLPAWEALPAKDK